MSLKIILIIYSTIISLHWITPVSSNDRNDQLLRSVGEGYGIPEKPLNPPPPSPVYRSSPTNNDADYVIEEFPSETPVKSKPIDSPDREPVYVDRKEQVEKAPEAVKTRQTFNNVRPPVPAIPSAIIDPPLGGYEDARDAVVNRPIGGNEKYPSISLTTETNSNDHLADACTCVPYFQCDDDGYMITSGGGIIDPRISIAQRHTPSNSYLNDKKVGGNFCGAYQVCCKGRSRQSQQNTQQILSPTCGTRNPSGISPRILTPGSARSESEFGEWPWMAAILKVDNGVHIFQCGATLIDDSHVITVAHCVSKFANNYPGISYNLVVRLGEWDTQQESEVIQHEDYQVIKVIIHPEFENQSLWNDIAILKLDRVVAMKQNINPVCLPTPADVFDGRVCTTTGWGKNAYQGGSYSNIMKEAQLPVIPRRECLKSLRSTRLGPRFRLHPSFICAGGEEGVDSCKGDGGGPLVCERTDGSYAVAGLVAWGIDCGQPGVPGVYVNVQQFLRFIDESRATHFEPESWGRTPSPNIPTIIQQPAFDPYQQRPNSNKYKHPVEPGRLPPSRRPSIDSTSQVRPPQSFPASGY